MAGRIGFILAVQLLGCTRIGQIVGDSKTIGLNRAYQTTTLDRGQTGTPVPTSTQARESGWRGRGKGVTLRRNSAGKSA